jgi:hypothetical protein
MSVRFGYTRRLFSGTVTGEGNTQATPIKCKFEKEAIFYLNVTALTGWLDIEIQLYNPLTGEWHKLATFDRVTTICNDEGFVEYGIGEKLAVKYDTNDSATFSLDVHLK